MDNHLVDICIMDECTVFADHAMATTCIPAVHRSPHTHTSPNYIESEAARKRSGESFPFALSPSLSSYLPCEMGVDNEK